MLRPTALAIRPEWAALIFDKAKSLEIRAYPTRVAPNTWMGVLESGSGSITGIVKFLGNSNVPKQIAKLKPPMFLVVRLSSRTFYHYDELKACGEKHCIPEDRVLSAHAC